MAITNFLNIGRTDERETDAFKPMESPFSTSPFVESPTVKSPEPFFPGFGIDPFADPLKEATEEVEEISWWEQRLLDKEKVEEVDDLYGNVLEEDSFFQEIMDGNPDALNKLAEITEEMSNTYDKTSEFLTKKFLSDTYDLTAEGSALLYDWYAQGGRAASTVKLIDALPSLDWAVSIGDTATKGAVLVADLPPLEYGEVIYDAEGKVADIIFDTQYDAANPVSSLRAGVEDAERRAVIEETLDRQKAYANIAEGIANVAATFATIDAYKKDPNLGTGLGVAHTVSSTAAFFTGSEAAASIAQFTGPLYYMYLGTELIKALAHDQDYERYQATMSYSDGKFVTESSSAADFSYKGEKPTAWSDAHGKIASEYLNRYIDKYNLTVDEDILNNYLSRNNYIGSNPYYNTLDSGRVGSGQEFFYNVAKSGALMVTAETDPSYYMRSQDEMLNDFQTTFKAMQNDIAEEMYKENSFNIGNESALFTDKDRAERVAIEIGTQYGTYTDPFGSEYETSSRYVVEDVENDEGKFLGYRLVTDSVEKQVSVGWNGKSVPVAEKRTKTPTADRIGDVSLVSIQLGSDFDSYQSYKELDFEKAFGMNSAEFADAEFGNQYIVDVFKNYNALIYENEVSPYRTYRGNSEYEVEMRDRAIEVGLTGLVPPLSMLSEKDKLAMKKFMRPEHYDMLFAEPELTAGEQALGFRSAFR